VTLQAGARLELRIGPVAHGGHMVARTPEGLVVFVRHALPDELVVVEITEEPAGGGRFLRGDAVEVLEPSAHRVSAPCPYAGPGACGGCDFQHVDLAEQRRLKGAVVSEQLARLAGIERKVVVEEVPPDLHWRSRMQYVDLPDGGVGLRKHRSHEVVEIDQCLIDASSVVERGRRGQSRDHGDLGLETVAAQPPRPAVGETVTTSYGTHTFEVAADGFWQPHVEAPRVLVETALEMLAPREGERALDLYAGVGLFSAFLAGAVGPGGNVVAVEGDRVASRHSQANLAEQPWVRAVHGPVDRVLRRGLGRADVVVLDPPRTGAKRAVVRAIAALGPRAVAYVACDPAALARDLGYFAEEGGRLESLRAFDLFPMTHHVECVALIVPSESTQS
jgi:tRNA/tmRNA/rRNA uracil-C5-methylase (TrmA/RlmC/RlmD family)